MHTQQITCSHSFRFRLLGVVRESQGSGTAGPEAVTTPLQPRAEPRAVRAALRNARFRSVLWVQLLAVKTHSINPVKGHAVSFPGLSNTHKSQIHKLRKIQAYKTKHNRRHKKKTTSWDAQWAEDSTLSLSTVPWNEWSVRAQGREVCLLAMLLQPACPSPLGTGLVFPSKPWRLNLITAELLLLSYHGISLLPTPITHDFTFESCFATGLGFPSTLSLISLQDHGGRYHYSKCPAAAPSAQRGEGWYLRPGALTALGCRDLDDG